jgi:MFS family permease
MIFFISQILGKYFFMSEYLKLMRRNIKLSYVKAAFHSLMYFIPIWYVFETGYASVSTLGLIYAIAHIFTVVLELPTGALADLIGRKKTVILACFLIGGGWFYISQAQNETWIWIGYFINALGSALLSGADVALDFDSLKELGEEDKFAEFKSKVGLIFRLGMVAATFLGGYIYSLHFRLPYILVGFNLLISGVLSFWQTEPKIDSEKFTLENYIKQTKLGIKQLTKSAYIKDLAIYYVLICGISWYFIYFLSMVYVTELGFDDKQRGILYGVIFLVMALANFGLVKWKWMTKERIYVLFPSLIVLGMIPAFWVNRVIAVVILFLNHLAGTLRFSMLNQYANKEFESKYRATAISALNMAVSLVFAIISITGGRVISYFQPNGAKILMTGLGVLTLIIAIPTTRVLLVNHNGRK